GDAKKGTYRLARGDVEAVLAGIDPVVCGLFALWIPARTPDGTQAQWLRGLFHGRAFVAVELHREQDDAARLQQLLALAARLEMTAVAAGDVHMDVRRRRMLQDTMTAIRHGTPLAEC